MGLVLTLGVFSFCWESVMRKPDLESVTRKPDLESVTRKPGLASIPALVVDLLPGPVRPVTWKLILQWLPCQAPGVIGSPLGLVGPVSLLCNWVKLQVWSATFSSVWQHVQLSEQIRPWNMLACCWNVELQRTISRPWELHYDWWNHGRVSLLQRTWTTGLTPFHAVCTVWVPNSWYTYWHWHLQYVHLE